MPEAVDPGQLRPEKHPDLFQSPGNPHEYSSPDWHQYETHAMLYRRAMELKAEYERGLGDGIVRGRSGSTEMIDQLMARGLIEKNALEGKLMVVPVVSFSARHSKMPKKQKRSGPASPKRHLPRSSRRVVGR